MKENFKTLIKKQILLEHMKRCKSTLLNLNFIMIYIVLKISVLRLKVSELH